MDDSNTLSLSSELGRRLLAANAQVTTAESCTGGLLAGAITDIPGSSSWFTRSVVTYSNEAKRAMLNVDAGVIEQYGAVSEACVRSMATGALQLAGAQVAVAVSGIAGPEGATPGKPVGTVWIGWALALPAIADSSVDAEQFPASEGQPHISADCFHFLGDRLSVRHQAVFEALRGTIFRMDQNRI